MAGVTLAQRFPFHVEIKEAKKKKKKKYFVTTFFFEKGKNNDDPFFCFETDMATFFFLNVTSALT